MKPISPSEAVTIEKSILKKYGARITHAAKAFRAITNLLNMATCDPEISDGARLMAEACAEEAINGIACHFNEKDRHKVQQANDEIDEMLQVRAMGMLT